MLKIPLELIQKINSQLAWEYSVIPKAQLSEGKLEVYISSSADSFKCSNDLGVLLGECIELIPLEGDELKKLLLNYYPLGGKKTGKKNLNISSDFLDMIIEEANDLSSSDIHIEIYEDDCRVRFRVDGKLIERYKVDKLDYPSLINKIKIKANLDISEKRLPQDGRLKYKTETNDFDIRVSVLPTLQGEKVVLRLLSKDTADIGIKMLGMSDEQIIEYRKGISRPHGIVLISGPTGSGKTTTLYSTLKELNTVDKNILTIEDPIEYTLAGINQVQVKDSIGMTYSEALKTFLRQDPDIIMLGEIRDTETAQMAVRASLTGHLVFSTIHTNSAWGTISRLLDMGVPAYLLANTLNMSIAQRLVRTLCPHCKKIVEMGFGEASVEKYLDGKIDKYAISVGCSHCYYTGFKGRKAVYELIYVDDEVQKCIKDGGDIENIESLGSVKYLKDGVVEMIRGLESSPLEVLGYLI
jgi:general secretion pathway protein E/type IV pilus assembly protein PilB